MERLFLDSLVEQRRVRRLALPQASLWIATEPLGYFQAVWPQAGHHLDGGPAPDLPREAALGILRGRLRVRDRSPKRVLAEALGKI